jgi:uncharacterized protein involved in cysteine biosynthesis
MALPMPTTSWWIAGIAALLRSVWEIPLARSIHAAPAGGKPARGAREAAERRQVGAAEVAAASPEPLHTRQPRQPWSRPVIDAFVKAIGQLGDPAIRRVLWLGIGVSLAVLATLWTGVGYLLTQTTFFQTGWFLFPVVISAFVGLFLERIAEAVERRYYPALPPGRDIPFGEALGGSLRFLALTVALNLVVLLFLIVPPVFPFVFYGVNGYLLSREYFEVVAARRMPAADVRTLRKQHMRRLFLSGLVVAFLLTVPIVNLLAPIVGTAAMVHIFHRLRGATPTP